MRPAGQFMLRRAYRPLVARDPRHRTLMRAWLLIYAFVGIQMGWVLRPFVGSPQMRFVWFRPRDSNFFEAVAETLSNLFS